MSHEIIHQSKITHSYPTDWRTKQPILFRASLQWFFDTEKIKDLAIVGCFYLVVSNFVEFHLFVQFQESLQKVKFYPEATKKGMMSELKSRNYWCISRQRSWGVPIPVFTDKISKKSLISRSEVLPLFRLTS